VNWRHATQKAAIVAAFALLWASAVRAQTQVSQSPCLGLSPTLGPVFDQRVICTLPQLYGPAGLTVFSPGSIVPGTLQTSAPNVAGNFVPENNFLFSVNQAIASQIASLPLVAPAAGLTVVIDPVIKAPMWSYESFGPIFSERATTIGRHRFAIGFSYQYMDFSSLDGIDIRSLPTLFVQSGNVGFTTIAPTHDYITASNNIGLKIHQSTVFATFGLFEGLDVSVAVPILSVSMRVAADSSIVPNSSQPGFISFNAKPSSATSNGTCLSTLNSASGNAYCARAVFSNSQSASGIGDLTIRLKGILKSWKKSPQDSASRVGDGAASTAAKGQGSERISSFGAGLDVRIPTADERNFLGTGAVGLRPFLIWSRSGRLSPHANFGYQWNGKSILASNTLVGNPAASGEHNLPGQLIYSLGLETGVSRRLTVSADLVGQTVLDAGRIHLVQAEAPGLCDTFSSCSNPGQPVQQTTVEGYKGTYRSNNASVAVRYRPLGAFLLSASVLLKLDNGGLRSKAIPLVSATYMFH